MKMCELNKLTIIMVRIEKRIIQSQNTNKEIMNQNNNSRKA